ncbi:MAG TPA: histidine--tRNA ligase [Candidatus Obscuribacterales bacterium]
MEKLNARLPRGLSDRGPAEIDAISRIVQTIREVYELYGFEPLETPLIEYSDALGKFLPDQDRPNAGVFSFQDEDKQWLSLRYDLTAPLARFVAENYETITKPFRTYRFGWVFRNEWAGPGRFRQFMQFDADTVGSASPTADAELCMMAADVMERIGVPRGSYAVKINNRKILDGVLESVGLAREDNAERKLTAMRAIDKLDRLGADAVRLLLTKGRFDEAGNFTAGAELTDEQAALVMSIFLAKGADNEQSLTLLAGDENAPELRRAGVAELRQIAELVKAAGYDDGRIVIDPSVVRGLEYYTGTVFEVELTIPLTDESGAPVRFGSVGGGGRYDGLVSRYRSDNVPATGFSIGVSRLLAALKLLGKLDETPRAGPVVVIVFDKSRVADYQAIVTRLRSAGIRSELYVGAAGLNAQMKYADRRRAPCVVIQGPSEREQRIVQIKDLAEGLKAAKTHEEWKQRPWQFAVPEDQLVDAVQQLLERKT